MNELEQLEFWIQKEIDESDRLRHDILLGKHHEGMIAAYSRVIRRIHELKGESTSGL